MSQEITPLKTPKHSKHLLFLSLLCQRNKVPAIPKFPSFCETSPKPSTVPDQDDLVSENAPSSGDLHESTLHSPPKETQSGTPLRRWSVGPPKHKPSRQL